MKMILTSATTPAQYVASFRGWRRELLDHLRKAVRGAAPMEETLKWGHLVYVSNGPVLLIRVEPERVLFGFLRGQRLASIEPRLKAGGKYELATLDLRKGDSIPAARARRLAKAAVALNASEGDPTKVTGTR